MLQHLTFSERYFFTIKIFLETREERSKGPLSGEYGGCTMK